MQLTLCHRQNFMQNHVSSCLNTVSSVPSKAAMSRTLPLSITDGSKQVKSRNAAQRVTDSLTCSTFDILAYESTGETACAIHREAGASRSLCSPPAGEGPEFRVSQGVCTY